VRLWQGEWLRERVGHGLWLVDGAAGVSLTSFFSSGDSAQERVQRTGGGPRGTHAPGNRTAPKRCNARTGIPPVHNQADHVCDPPPITAKFLECCNI
jgi:hypothetical protein